MRVVSGSVHSVRSVNDSVDAEFVVVIGFPHSVMIVSAFVDPEKVANGSVVALLVVGSSLGCVEVLEVYDDSVGVAKVSLGSVDAASPPVGFVDLVSCSVGHVNAADGSFGFLMVVNCLLGPVRIQKGSVASVRDANEYAGSGKVAEDFADVLDLVLCSDASVLVSGGLL